MYFKEAILCLMFAVAEADGQMRDDELIAVVTMKEIFKGYHEQDIVQLYKEYKKRFEGMSFTDTANILARQIPDELAMATLSLLGDVIVLDFNVDIKESSFMSIVAHVMGVSDTAVKTLLLASLSKKLMINVGQKDYKIS
jgi:uncharacterized tellurite resistance protein B-like protein